MKARKLLGLVPLGLAGALVGATGGSAQTDINPALLYYQAFAVAPVLSQADSDYLFNTDRRGQVLPERFGKLIAGYDNEFRLLRQAAASTTPCDWGIDLSAGPATLLPHLARTKAVTLATQERMLWELQQGRPAEACQDLLAALALSRNVARDGTLISTLVELANEAINCHTIAANFGRFPADTLKQLADGLNALPAQHTAAECIPVEKVLGRDWLLRQIEQIRQANAGDDAKAMAAVHALFESALGDGPNESNSSEPDNVGWWNQMQQAAGGTSAGMLQLVRDLDSFDPKVMALLSASYSDYPTQLAQFRNEVQQASNPLLQRLFATGWEKVRPKEFRVETYLAMVRAALAYKLHGEAGLQSVADPCGHGSFAFRRFVFEGVDRGFELRSAFDMDQNKAVLIFVETEGPPFQVGGNYPGRAVKGK